MLFATLNACIGPHQAALADALYNILGEKFVFIEFGRKDIQFGSFKGMTSGMDYYKDRPYILKMYESEENEKKAKELIENVDVLRTGGEPLELTEKRIIRGKLTFRSSERIVKKWEWYTPLKLRSLYLINKRLDNPNYRLLCQSAYLPNDMSLIHAFKNKMYKFAYYTDVPDLDCNKRDFAKKSQLFRIVWCARFIDWKHPEIPLELAQKLIKSGRKSFEIRMIGADTTDLWRRIKETIDDNCLNQHVFLTGGLPNSDVLKLMKECNAFIFTSDRREGWGAVLNEAMSTGCACVASNEIGAVPYLLKNNQNGLVFKSRSSQSLFEQVKKLYDDRELCDRLGKEAYYTISHSWSAKVAAERLVQLADSILNKKEISFDDGPCSIATSIHPKKVLQ